MHKDFCQSHGEELWLLERSEWIEAIRRSHNQLKESNLIRYENSLEGTDVFPTPEEHTLEIPKELIGLIRTEALKEGLSVSKYIINILQERFQSR